MTVQQMNLSVPMANASMPHWHVIGRMVSANCRILFRKKCIYITKYLNFLDCGDATDEIGCLKHNGKSCHSKGDNGGCRHLCTDVTDGYYCHCRDGFRPDPANPLDCADIDECAGNNTCTQQCINTKGIFKNIFNKVYLSM